MTSGVPRVGVIFRPQLPPEDLRGFVTLAEQAGLDDVWLWEDCFLEGGLTSATAALSWSTSLRLGLGLMPVPVRNPALAAMEVATLARLFPGRFAPAVGHGVLDWMAQVGARAASPITLLREWVTAARALLHGETVTTAGEYIRLDNVALDWPPATVPPLLVGGRGPRTLAIAGELADGMVLDAAITPAGVRRAVERAAAQRAHDVVVYLMGGAGPDSLDKIQAELTAWGHEPNPDTLAVGSPDQVADLIHRYAEAGATTVVLQPAGTDLDPEPLITLAADARAALLKR